jgi:hypothetical protein
VLDRRCRSADTRFSLGVFGIASGNVGRRDGREFPLFPKA